MKLDTPWKKVLLVVAIVVLIVAIGGGLYAIYKPLRAQQLASEGLKAMEAGDVDLARQKVRAANSLASNNLEVARALAKVWSKIAPADVVPLWEHVNRLSDNAVPDRQFLILALMEAGELDRAKKELDELLKTAPEDNKTLYVKAIWQAASSQTKEAHDIALELLKKDPTNTDYWELYGSLVARLKQPQKDVYIRKLEILFKSPDNLGLWAGRELVVYSRDPEEFKKRCEALLKHPSADRFTVLFVNTLRRSNLGTSYEEIRKEVAPLFNMADNEERKMLGRFYRTIGDNEAIVELIPAKMALLDREALLLHIDALAGLKKWNELLEIMAMDKLPLQDYWREIFRARAYNAMGKENEAQLSWRKSLSAAGTDTAALGEIARYMMTMGALEEFEEVMRRIVQNAGPIEKQNYYKFWISVALRTGDIKRIQTLLENAVAEFPNNTVILNDYIYYSLLSGKEGDWVLKSYELAKAAPNVLAHRMTLALALYKSGQNKEAFEVMEKTRIEDWSLISPGWQCVRAAIYKKAGRGTPEIADIEMALKEEQELLK